MQGNNEIEQKLTDAWEDRKNNLRASFNIAIHLFQETTQANYQKGIADSSKILGYCYWRVFRLLEITQLLFISKRYLQKLKR